MYNSISYKNKSFVAIGIGYKVRYFTGYIQKTLTCASSFFSKISQDSMPRTPTKEITPTKKENKVEKVLTVQYTIDVPVMHSEMSGLKNFCNT